MSSEKLKSILDDIGMAKKILESFREKSSKLLRVTEEVRKQADEVNSLKFSNEPLLEKLKDELQFVLASAHILEEWFKGFGGEIKDLDVRKFVEDKSTGNTGISQEAFQAFCDKLMQAYKEAGEFLKEFKSFTDHLSKSQLLAKQLSDRLKQNAEWEELKAKTPGGLVVGAVGLAALGFFTGGAAWAVLGAAACGVGATAGYACLDLKELRAQAEKLREESKKINVVAEDLKYHCKEANNAELTEEEMTELKTALEIFKRDLKKDELIALQQERLAELEEKLRRHGIE